MGRWSTRQGESEGVLLKRGQRIADAANAWEPSMRSRSDEELTALARQLADRHRQGTEGGTLLAQAAAVVRESALRALGHRLDDVQIIGGIALHHGALVEMRTGEGKTLTVLLPAYLGAAAGRGVHVMTSNDYLAQRDAAAMEPVLRRLGLSCGLLLRDGDDEGSGPAGHRAAYAADVTYGTPFAFAYDHLRDHMVWERDDVVQRGRHLAIVDEADLVMLDDARRIATLSRSVEGGRHRYTSLTRMVAGLRDEVHYRVDRQRGLVTLTEAGTARVEDLLGLDDLQGAGDTDLMRMLDSVLLAKEVYRRDIDYLVEDGAIEVLDTGTGRFIPRGSLPGGLMPALAAKEGLAVPAELRAIASVPIHMFLRGYERLAGLTGVAVEAEGYRRIYGLETVKVPTSRPVLRVDRPIRIHSTNEARLAEAVRRTAEHHAAGRPVLLGTGSITQAEEVSAALHARGVPHELLTARNHADEAAIIAPAGEAGRVTVVTRMVGRGVDIPLGGVGASAEEREAVRRSGGLQVLALDLYETRRPELHMRGRAGRRGDPGSSEVLVALDDPTLARLLSPRLLRFLRTVLAGEAMDNRMVSRALERELAHRTAYQVEALCDAVRYDEVEEEQRERIGRMFRQTRDTSDAGAMRERVLGALDATITRLVRDAGHGPDAARRLHDTLSQIYPVTVGVGSLASAGERDLGPLLLADARGAYRRRAAELTPEVMTELERRVHLAVISRAWKNHMTDMKDLFADATLHAITGSDLLARYRREAAALFTELLEHIELETVGYLFNLDVRVTPIDRGGREDTA